MGFEIWGLGIGDWGWSLGFGVGVWGLHAGLCGTGVDYAVEGTKRVQSAANVVVMIMVMVIVMVMVVVVITCIQIITTKTTTTMLIRTRITATITTTATAIPSSLSRNSVRARFFLRPHVFPETGTRFFFVETLGNCFYAVFQL